MATRVYLAYDERMTLHKPLPALSESDSSSESSSPSGAEKEEKVEEQTAAVNFENHHRVHVLYHRLLRLETMDGYRRFIEIPCIPASQQDIELVHSPEHYDYLRRTSTMSDEELRLMSLADNDLYFCKETFMAAKLAAGGVIECVKAVTDPRRRSRRAIAIVRPPGHHATRDRAMGFCYFNNVAVAAKYATYTGRANRVFILDWDIHHGNGIQDLTYNDPQIFYLSIHRASFGSKNWFYPGTGRPSEVGQGDGEGTNLNIAWGQGGMGDEEYAAAFREVVLPLLQHFKPELIIIACGLDAVQGDLIGDCGLSEEMYYSMTRSLVEAAPQVSIVSALEGGYNIEKSARCMENVALALLDEPLDFQQSHQYVTWSARSILPQKSHVVVTKEAKRIKKRFPRMQGANDDENNSKHETPAKVNCKAIKAIRRSADALERKGGTCLCGCHFRCHHTTDNHCLPIKKRKLYEMLSSSSEGDEDDY